MAVDYDAPRSTPPSDDSGLDVFTIRRGTTRSGTADVDEVATGSLDIDTIDDELTGPVIAMRADEFRCQRCFLITHRHQLVDRNGTQICRECA